MIIGLTGLNGAGKGVVAEYLVSKKGFICHSLSDIVREEVLKEDNTITREKLIVTANTLRREHGPSVLAGRIIKRIDRSKNTVVDSFRNPEEVQAFSRQNNFELWCITASRENRFNRIRLRQREQDPQTIEEFIKVEEKELTSDNPENQNLLACQRLAHRTITNDNSLDDLYKQIENAYSGV